MKKLIIILFFIFSALGFSQEYSKEVQSQFLDYTNLIINKDFEKAIDRYGNEDFLKLIPKNQLLAAMDQIFNSKEMEFKTYQPTNFVVEDKVFKKNGQSYLKLDYSQRVDMKFNSKELKKEQLLPVLQKEFGADNVSYNEKTSYYEINTRKTAVANSSDEKKWKFTVLEKNQLGLLSQFIPEIFLKENSNQK